MKLKGLSLLTALAIALSTLSGFAQGTNNIQREGEIPITQYIEIDESATASDGAVTLPSDAQVSYSVSPESAGWYKLIAKGKGLQDKIAVTATLGEETYTGYFNKTNRENAMGRFYLSEGENIITIKPETEITYTKLYMKSIEHSVGAEPVKIAMVDYKSTTTPEHDYVNNQWNYSYDGVTGCVVTASATTSYFLDVAETGIYKVTLHSKSNEAANVELLLNGETVSKTTTEKKSEVAANEFPPFVLEEGQYELVISDKGPSDIRYNYYFIIEKIAGIIDVAGLYAGNEPIEDGAGVPKSTDVFRFDLTAQADEESFSPQISANGKTLKSTSYCDENNGYLLMCESLEEGIEYKISTGKITDIYGFFTSEDTEFTITASETSENNASMENVTAKISGSAVTVNGTMKSSMGMEISGRRALLYIKDAEGNVTAEAVDTAVSGEDGKFELSYTVPDGSVSGTYTAIVQGEYVAKNTEMKFTYISSSLENEIMTAVADADTAGEMQTVVGDYASMLGINLTSELPSREISDKSKVYAGIVGDKGKISSTEDLVNIFRAHAAMQTVLQTTKVNRVYSTLTDEAKAGYVGVDSAKMLAVTNGTYKDNMLVELKTRLAENEITDVEVFAEICNTVINKWLAKQYDKTDLQIKTAKASVFVGQEFEIPIELSEEANNVSRLVMNIKASEDMFDDAELQAEKGTFEKSDDDGVITLTYIPSDLSQGVEKIGSIMGVAGKTGTFIAEISGIAEFDEGIGVNITTKIPESDLTLSVKKNTQKGEVSQKPSGGGGGGGGSRPSSPVVSVPAVKPDAPQTPVAEKFEFKDLENAEWAKESIAELLDRKIISESDDKNFNPHREMTRAEFAKMIVTALGLKAEGAGTGLMDISENQWYYEYVRAAEEHGLIMGDENGFFNAESSITRQDMAVIIMRVFEKLDFAAMDAKEAFADDADIAEYAKTAVYTMKEMGVLNGVGEEKFAPKGNVTRAMGAKVVFEMLKVVGI